MKKFNVKARFVFTGNFFVSAENKEQAAEYVLNHCGLVIGGDIHSTLSSETVDWDFPAHPVTSIGRIKEIPGGE